MYITDTISSDFTLPFHLSKRARKRSSYGKEADEKNQREKTEEKSLKDYGISETVSEGFSCTVAVASERITSTAKNGEMEIRDSRNLPSISDSHVGDVGPGDEEQVSEDIFIALI